MKVNQAAIPELMVLYHHMRDPKYKSKLGWATPPRIEWVGRGPNDKVKSPTGLGRLLAKPEFNSKTLSADEHLLGALHYSSRVIRRYAHKRGIYIQELDQSYHDIEEYFQPVSQTIGHTSESTLVGFRLKDQNGTGLKQLWDNHPRAQDAIVLKLAYNIYEGYPMPKAARAFLFSCLIGDRTLPKTSALNSIGQEKRPVIAHRDYLLCGLANSIRERTAFASGANQTNLLGGNPIPICGASIAIAAMKNFHIPLSQRNGILLANKNCTSFQMDGVASEILALFSWSERRQFDLDSSLLAEDLSASVQSCLVELSSTF